MLKLKIGDRFKDVVGDYCEVISIKRSWDDNKMFLYSLAFADNETKLNALMKLYKEDKGLVSGEFIGQYDQDTIDAQHDKGNLTLLNQKVTNWRKELK